MEFLQILEEEKTELLPKNTARHEQEYNLTDNSFVIRSTRLFFMNTFGEAKRSAIFTQARSQGGEKCGFIFA